MHDRLLSEATEISCEFANLVFALCNCLLCIAAPFSYECLKKVAIVLINKV